ncbi:hypothetical protein [Alteromonas sp. a30]|uniref:hypothetical protein n=1 Tax=Alteromonas sp. a30 TaxID=2730917 RepID=UPI0022816D4F|nr:hypothetical protein [Alteromonas sp. a30]MCY7296051.1 hypothetical protein [Alteromonas sp. a30]
MQPKRNSLYLRLYKILPLIIATLMLSMSTNVNAKQNSECLAEPDWFPHSQTPRPNDATFKSSTNCVFHQWSWQMFLWLTQEDENGNPRFLSFESPQSLIGMEHRGLMPRRTKHATAMSFDEYLQAGTDGILIDHNGKAVYYSQYVNPTFANFIKGKDESGNYNKSQDFRFPQNVINMGKTAPQTEFPIYGTAGALELKAAWRVVKEGEDTSDVFTMKTELAKLVNTANGIQVNHEETYSATVALVGFHIAGIVQGHPEMIWATFEHHNNAPDVQAGTSFTSPVSPDDYTFYTANTKLQDCNINPAKDGMELNEATQTFTPITQVCRRYPFGNAPNEQQSNTAHITQLNASVQSKLDNGDVWENYDEIGAIWFGGEDKLVPGLRLADDSLLTGSLKLSNSTIETFTQVADSMNNCFRCHNTAQEFPPKMSLDPLPATNLNISHAFQNIFFWSQELEEVKTYLNKLGDKK